MFARMRVVEKNQLMSATEIDRTLQRLAHEIVEKSGGTANLALIGIRRRGVPLAQRIARSMNGIERRGSAGRNAGHHALPRRSLQDRFAARAAFERDIRFPWTTKTCSWWTTCSIPDAPFARP